MCKAIQVPTKDNYLVSNIEEFLDELYGAKLFSKFNLRLGYHHIRMRPEDVPKIVFHTHEEHYEFLVMPFGPTNAPSTFQGLIEIFGSYLRKFVFVFFSNILIYSKTMGDHASHLGVVLTVLQHHQLYTKTIKCVFGC